MKITYYVASSMDGYIAKQDGDVSWLDDLDITPEDAGYDAFYATVDALVMGRNTYDKIKGFGAWPYADKPTWVCTSRELEAIEACNLQLETLPLDIQRKAIEIGVNHLWLVGGGKLASTFIEQKPLTDISISQMPIILGGGIKLFGKMDTSKKIKRVRVDVKSSGFNQLDYVLE